MKTFLTIWKINLTNRLPILLRGLEEAVYIPPRLVYGLYSTLVVLYWTLVATISVTWLAGCFSYSQGRKARGLLTHRKQDTLGNLKAFTPHPLPSAAPALEQIDVSQLTTTAAQKVLAASPDQVVLARRWGKGWRVTILTPEEATSIQDPWKLVVRQ